MEDMKICAVSPDLEESSAAHWAAYARYSEEQTARHRKKWGKKTISFGICGFAKGVLHLKGTSVGIHGIQNSGIISPAVFRAA